MPKRTASAPTRVSKHTKRTKTTPVALSLDDEWLWSSEPLPVAKMSVPLCCAMKTCKKCSSEASETDREVAGITSLLCEETISPSSP